MAQPPIGKRFAPNLDRLWPEEPVARRFELAAEHGFEQVEFLYPQDHDPDVVDEALRRTGCTFALFNAGVEPTPSSRRGLLAVPGREEDFAAFMARDLTLARRWGVRRLHAVAGFCREPGAPGTVRTAVANLRRVADDARAAGVLLLVEFLNPHDRPGYAIGSFADAAKIVTLVDDPAVRLQFDQYHVAMAGLDPIAQLRRHHALVGHVQVAEVPSRQEPAPDSSQLSDFIRALEEVGYAGLVGLEYDPPPDGEITFDWLEPWRRPSA